MKFRPSAATWDNLNSIFNSDEKNTAHINRIIVALTFFVLVLFGIILCSN